MSAVGDNGSAVVLLPGMLCTSRLWDGVRGQLSDLGQGPVVDLEVVRPSVDDNVDALLELPQRRLTLVGLSLGAIVAMAAARTAPERVERLVLLSTNARGPTDEQRRGWDRMAQRVHRGEFPRITPEELTPVLLAPSRRHDDALADVVVDMATAVGPERFLAQLATQQSRRDERETLARLRCPTLVLAARDDQLCPVSRHEEIATLVSSARLSVVEGAGHLSPLEQPTVVARTLADWLSEPRACPSG